MRVSAVRVLYVYGLFLLLGGVVSFAASGFTARAKTALLMGGGCGFSMALCAFLGSHGRPRALKIGRMLATLYLALFLYRGWMIRNVEAKQYLFFTFMVLSFGSSVAAVLLSVAPPSAAERAATQRNNNAAKAAPAASSAASKPAAKAE
jgi:hypothetical protein